jgi:hypothetical protein
MAANYQQGDLVELIDPTKTPTGTLRHPILIVSSNRSNGYEYFYTGVMMTSSDQKDSYSFHCTDEMFENPLRLKNCKLRLYITASFKESEISKKINKMKTQDFKQVLKQLNDLVFSIV